MGYSRRPRERQMEGKGDAVTDGGVNPRDRRGPAWPPWSTSGPALFAVGERARRVDPDAAGVSAPAGWKRAAGPGFVVHVDPVQESPLAFALSVAAGLDERPRRLDARYLYDAAGSDLFDRITSQPEYYLPRAEDQLLANGARAIRAAAGFGTLAELGSGTSTKTRRLLAAWCAAGPAAYGPVDVDLHFLTQACATLRADYPTLAIEGLGASYDRALPVLAEVPPKTLALLGSRQGARGERILTEFSHMFRADGLGALGELLGFRRVWSDVGDGDFGLFLFRRMAIPTLATRLPAQGDHAVLAANAPLALLGEMRARTLELVAPLGEGDLQRQHSRLMSPLAWDLGHIAEFEEQWLLRGGQAGAGEAALYDPHATPRARRDQLVLPSPAAVRHRMREVRHAD